VLAVADAGEGIGQGFDPHRFEGLAQGLDLVADLAAPAVNRARVREIISSLVVTTRDVAANNRTLG
jgi:hypothetical protein